MILRKFSPLLCTILALAVCVVSMGASDNNNNNKNKNNNNSNNNNNTNSNISSTIEPDIESRIVGGQNVSIVNHPHQVSLRMRDCSICPYFHKCGGSIYRDNTIITAAHCVYQRAIYDIVVVAGTNNRNGSDGATSRIDKIFIHDKFNSSITDYDVAVLLLATKLPVDNVRMAPLKGLANERPAEGTNVLVTGWGMISEGGPPSHTLNEIQIPILNDERCLKAYGSASYTGSMLCAGRTGKDACQDDSGGPMVTKSGELVGITSWAIGCARPDYPGVYTSIADVREWIEQTTPAEQKAETKL